MGGEALGLAKIVCPPGTGARRSKPLLDIYWTLKLEKYRSGMRVMWKRFFPSKRSNGRKLPFL